MDQTKKEEFWNTLTHFHWDSVKSCWIPFANYVQ